MRSDVLALAVLLLGSCADFERGERVEAPGVDDDDATGDAAPSFAAEVRPLLLDHCESCHGTTSAHTFRVGAGADADYETILPFIDETAPADSTLLAKVTGSGHGGGTIFAAGSPEYELLLTWIEGGASP